MSSQGLVVIEEVEDGEESKLKTDSSKNSNGIEKDAPENPKKDGEDNEDGTDNKENKCVDKSSVSSTESQKPSLGQFDAGDEDEGFRTPTDLAHRIPVITECPPAPRRKRPNLSIKRKEISPRIRRSLHLDFSSAVVEPIFRPTLQEDDTNPDNKRVRREDSE